MIFMGNLLDEFEDIEWSAEAEAEWQKLEELPDYEDVLEWQGKGWLWD
jgi:hypothetical protein